MKNFERYLIDALTEGSRGLQRLRRKGDLEGAKRKAKEGAIRKLATEFEGHAAGSEVDYLAGSSAPKRSRSSIEHIRGHKGRGVRAEDSPSFMKYKEDEDMPGETPASERNRGTRAARRAISRASGESESKKRKIGHAAKEAEEDRRERAQFRTSTNESFERYLIRALLKENQGDFDYEDADDKRKEEEKKRREEQSQWEIDHAANIDDLEDRKGNRQPNTSRRKKRKRKRKGNKEQRRTRGLGGWGQGSFM